MAFQMSVSLPTGEICQDTYWLPELLVLSPQTQTGRVVFLGWFDKSAHDAGLQTIGSHEYKITPTIYSAFIASIQANPSGFGSMAALYQLALAIQDTTDPQNSGNLISFFASATQV